MNLSSLTLSVSASVLFLIVVRAPLLPSGSRERCVYGHYLNLTQSTDIVCSSRFMLGSNYYHTISNTTVVENPFDIIHCEASNESLVRLNLYSDAKKDGLKLMIISSGPCMFINAAYCTCAVIYLNLSHFDQHNDSTIPVCSLNRQTNPNLECFCIRYLKVDVSTDHGHSNMATTETGSDHVTTINPEPCTAVISQVGYSAGAFKGSVTALSIVTVILLVILLMLAILYIVFRKKKSRRLPPQRLELTTDARFQTSQLPEPVKDNVEYTDGNRVETDHAWVPGDEAHSDDEEQRDIAETDALLQSPLVQRSLSCPARTPIDDGDVRGIMYSSAHSFKDCDS